MTTYFKHQELQTGAGRDQTRDDVHMQLQAMLDDSATGKRAAAERAALAVRLDFDSAAYRRQAEARRALRR